MRKKKPRRLTKRILRAMREVEFQPLTPGELRKLSLDLTRTQRVIDRDRKQQERELLKALADPEPFMV